MLLYLLGAIVLLSIYMIRKERSEKVDMHKEIGLLLKKDLRGMIHNDKELNLPKESNLYVLKKNSETLTSLKNGGKDLKLSDLQYSKLHNFKEFVKNKNEKELFSLVDKNHLYQLVSWTELDIEYVILEKNRTSLDSLFLKRK